MKVKIKETQEIKEVELIKEVAIMKNITRKIDVSYNFIQDYIYKLNVNNLYYEISEKEYIKLIQEIDLYKDTLQQIKEIYLDINLSFYDKKYIDKDIKKILKKIPYIEVVYPIVTEIPNIETLRELGDLLYNLTRTYQTIKKIKEVRK